jgi:glycosyltransferase involved in cell wall biosynthesis
MQGLPSPSPTAKILPASAANADAVATMAFMRRALSIMNTLIGPVLHRGPADYPARNGVKSILPAAEAPKPLRPVDMDYLRQCAWEIGERKPIEAYHPPVNHVGLAMVSPYQGFAHWRIRPEWIDETKWHKGDAWNHCRMVLRLYDVSFITFNGLNAHRIDNLPLPGICGQMFFNLPRPGTWQIAEVGFELRNGEFLPAARSKVVAFARDTASGRGDQAALLVEDHGKVEEVGNLWEQERVLHERRQPKLRQPLRIAAFSFEPPGFNGEGGVARFVSELAAGQCAQGHEVHVFTTASAAVPAYRKVGGVHYHPLEVRSDGGPLEKAHDFVRAAGQRLELCPSFELFHLHEWMTGLAPWVGSKPTVLSLHSLEVTRRNGTPPDAGSLAIQEVERELARNVDCILTPDWLRPRAVEEWGVDGDRIHAFPMEGRLPGDWDSPLDYGQVKKEIGFGPLDRLLLFVGPLEHAAGVDLLIEALPVLLQRYGNLRLALIGAGSMLGPSEYRAGQLGVSHAVRLLGHMEGPPVARLVRSAEALVLPSRYRVAFDDAVVDLARRGGLPVVTTHGGPAHLVRHEENGLVTYDNPGSMVWALDRILGDSGHAQRMGAAGRRQDGSNPCWSDVARLYLELCARCFPELAADRG